MSNVSSRNPIEEERTVDTPNTRARKIEEYMKRYEALQQERLRSFGRRASDDFGLEEEEVSLSKVNEHDDLPSVFKSKQNQPYEEYEEHEEQEKQQQQQQDEGEEEDLFSVFPSRTIQAFPHVSDTTNTTNKSSSMSKVSPYNRKKVKLQESFMDAEHFLVQQEHQEIEDSFLRELKESNSGIHNHTGTATEYTEEDYTKARSSMEMDLLSPVLSTTTSSPLGSSIVSSSSSSASFSRYLERPSDFFEKKSRNLDNIQFQSPPSSLRESILNHEKMKTSSIKKKMSTFFPRSPAVSSVLSQNEEQEMSVHFAPDRSVITPTSLRRLQQKFELTTLSALPSFNQKVEEEQVAEEEEEEEEEEDVKALSKRVDEIVQSVNKMELPSSLKMALEMDAYANEKPIKNKIKEEEEEKEEKELETISVAVKKVREAMQEIERLTSLSYEESLYQATIASKNRMSTGSSWDQTRSAATIEQQPPSTTLTSSTLPPSKPISRTSSRTPPFVLTTSSSTRNQMEQKEEEGQQSPIAAKSKLTVDHFKSDCSSRNFTSEVPLPSSIISPNEQQGTCTNDPTRFVTSGRTAQPTLSSSTSSNTGAPNENWISSSPSRRSTNTTMMTSTTTTINGLQNKSDNRYHNFAVLETPLSLPIATTISSSTLEQESHHGRRRLCRRFFCFMGEKMVEKMEIYNKSESIARICGSLLPITQGCNQFSMSPAVIELLPGQSGLFDIFLNAQVPGVVAGIFQFRGVHVDALDPPFELIIEAHITKRTHLIQSPSSSSSVEKQTKKKQSKSTTIKCTVEAIKEEEEEEESNHGVDISPTFLRFRVSNSSRSSRSRSSTNRSLTTSQNGSREEEEASSGHGNGHVVGVHREKVTLMNHSKEIKRFQIKSGHEHVLISPKEGTIEPFNTQLIRIRILSQPFQPKKKAKQNKTKPNLNLNQTQNQMKQQEETWCGSFTICITSNSSNETEMQQQIVREISIVLDPEILHVLPTFEEMVRLQHHLSLQTDSFYYSSSQKDNNTTTRHPNRGLYFHAEAVECGQCPLGEAHQVCVYLCNGSENPMTVFLQNLQEPFRCEYKTTTIKSKSYIPMTIIFRPKAKGKVSTSLTAYSLTTRASMTLIATGISK